MSGFDEFAEQMDVDPFDVMVVNCDTPKGSGTSGYVPAGQPGDYALLVFKVLQLANAIEQLSDQLRKATWQSAKTSGPEAEA